MRLLITLLLTIISQHSEIRDCIDWCALSPQERLKRPAPSDWNCPKDCSLVSPESEDTKEDPRLPQTPKKD
jgi:hypothetical protein